MLSDSIGLVYIILDSISMEWYIIALVLEQPHSL